MSEEISLNNYEKEMLELKLKQLKERKRQNSMKDIAKNNDAGKKRKTNEGSYKRTSKRAKEDNNEEDDIEVVEFNNNDDNWKSLKDIHPAPLEEIELPRLKKTSILDNIDINKVIKPPNLDEDDEDIAEVNECNKIFITIEIDDKKEKVTINENDCFDKVFAFLDRKKYEFKCLYTNKERILPTTTTKDLVLLSGDSITIRATKEVEGRRDDKNSNDFDEMKDDEEKKDEENKSKVSINLKLLGQKETIPVSLPPDGTFDRIVKYLLETRSYVVEKMIFDGEKIDLSSTPEDLDVEAGDEIQIDIKGNFMGK